MAYSRASMSSRFDVADFWSWGFYCLLQDSCGISCVSCVLCCLRRRRGGDFLVVLSLMMIYSTHLILFCPWSYSIGSARWFRLFDLLPFTHLPSRRDFFYLSPIRLAYFLASISSISLTLRVSHIVAPWLRVFYLHLQAVSRHQKKFISCAIIIANPA